MELLNQSTGERNTSKKDNYYYYTRDYHYDWWTPTQPHNQPSLIGRRELLKTMFNHFYGIKHQFLSEPQRNKLLVDSLITFKTSFPPKSDLGREIKNSVREVNKQLNWFFNIDKIEFLKVNILTSTNNPYHDFTLMIQEPRGIGEHQQTQRKLTALCKLNDNEENLSGGDLIIKSFDNVDLDATTLFRSGDLIVIPSFVPFRITPLSGTDQSVFLQCVISGPSFR